MKEYYVSLFKNAHATRPQHVSAVEILREIQRGKYKADIERLRKVKHNEKAYKAKKETLPAVAWAGMFTKRNKAGFETASGLFPIDLDHLEDVQGVKNALKQDKSVLFAFVSPGGDGIKAAYRIPPVKDDAQFKYAFNIIKERVKERTGLPIDEARKDISGLCFVSYDPELYLNDNAELIPIDFDIFEREQAAKQQEQQRKQAAKPAQRLSVDDKTVERWIQWKVDAATDMIYQSVDGERRLARFNAGRLLGGVISGFGAGVFSVEQAVSVLLPVASANTDHPEHVEKEIRDGITSGLDSPLTAEDAQAKFEDWKAQHPLERHNENRPPHPADTYSAPTRTEPPKQPAAPEQQPPAQQNTPNPKKQPTAKEAKPAPGVYCVTELEKVLNPLEQEGIREKLLDMRDPAFDLRKQYPYFYEYCHDLKPVTDAKPQALVTALLPALACNVGNRAYIQAFGAKHFCNIWAVNIARSTIGRKTTSLNMPLKPIHEFEKELHTAYAQKMKDFEAGRGDQPNPKEYIIYPNATSEAFFDVLQDNPNGLMMFSEIASFLSSMSKSYMADFKATITDFFDTPEIRSRRTRGTGETVVRRPCFSISAATTKDWLLSELNKDSQNDVHSGFLQRFLLCNSYDVDVNALNFEFTKGGDELTAVHQTLAGLFHGLRHVATSAEPVELELSEEAARMFSAVNKAIFTELVNKGNETLLSYAGRIFTGYFLRFCILFTLCDHVFDCLAEERAFDVFNTGETVVNSKNAEYALALCEYYFRCAQAFILGEVEKTEEARHEKQIVRIMMRHYEQTGKEVISRAILMQRAHLNRKDLDTALENLIDQGVIVQLNEDSRNGKGKIYYRIVV